MAFQRQSGPNGELGALKALIVALLCWSSTPLFVAGQSKVKGGYYLGVISDALSPSMINTKLFTHLFYAFASIDPSTSSVVAPSDDVFPTFSNVVKSSNPQVLTLISIRSSATDFSNVLLSNASQQAFIDSSIALARTYQFDGIDLDWEYPQTPSDLTNFALFLEKWRQAWPLPLLLTVAVSCGDPIWFTNLYYPISSIKANVDFLNIMCYDFHSYGSSDPNTGANANLQDPSSIVSGASGVSSWLTAGLPPSQAVLGLTLYGPTYALKDQNTAAGLNAPAIGNGALNNAVLTKYITGFFDPTVLRYYQVVEFIANAHATVVYDPTLVTTYAYANNTWVSYEDPQVITAKVQYIKSNNLRGYFFFPINDDSNWADSTAASETLDAAGARAGAW